jgi:hypothetical protein
MPCLLTRNRSEEQRRRSRLTEGLLARYARPLDEGRALRALARHASAGAANFEDRYSGTEAAGSRDHCN